MEYYSAIKKNEILSFATTWMKLESIMLTEISQSEKDKYHMITLICGTNELRKKEKHNKKHALNYSEQIGDFQKEGG